MLNRVDVRSDPPSSAPKPGARLDLTFNVTQMGANGACTALAGAHVDIWQCDAVGVYSDAKDALFNTIGQKFLRGYQLTDTNGAARFTTIYPGWYPGRAVHIHFKIRTNPKAPAGQEFTSQLYFDEALTDRVHAAPPYASKGKGRTLNEQDGIFKKGGRQLVLAVSEKSGGYAGAFNVALVKKA
jgi:protocatechuate 3,4-dioxygenase beta subunit